MSSDRELTHIVRSWLEEGVSVLPDRVVDQVLAQLPVTSQRRPFWRAWRKNIMSSTFKFAVAGAVALIVAVGGLGIYFSRPAVAPGGSPTPIASTPTAATPTQAASELTPGPQTQFPTSSPDATHELQSGLVAYMLTEYLQPGEGGCTGVGVIHCSIPRIWVVNADGTGAHQLWPDVHGRSQKAIGWSPDGSRLLYIDDGGLALTDGAGSEAEVLPSESLCPIDADNCGALLEQGVSFSPDGTRLAYVIAEGRDADISTIAILDLSTKQVSRLESTRSNVRSPCTSAASEGDIARPSWSPDGTVLVFEKQGIGPLSNGDCGAAVFVVNADGTDQRQLVPAAMQAIHPGWSPDGTRIVFHTSAVLPGWPQGETAVAVDLYTVRPDGSELRRLTEDGRSAFPRWTTDGRIVFRGPLVGEEEDANWRIMSPDGGAVTQLRDYSLAELTAVGCVACPYGMAPTWDGEAYWQPSSDGRPPE